MIKLDFPWYLTQAKDIKTKNKLRKWEDFFKRLKDKTKLVELKEKQNFPLKLGKYKIWVNGNNVFQSLHTYLEIFKELDHTRLKGFQGSRERTIVDIGANEGHYVLKMKEKLPKSKIIAVEPNSEAFKILQKNVKENKIKNVILVKKAVSSKNRKVKFERVAGVTQIGGLKIEDTSWFDKSKIEKIMVDSTSLERLLKLNDVKKVDILKIDAK